MYILRNIFLLRNQASGRYLTLLNQKRFVKLEPISITFLEETQETFEKKNKRLKRPLSPHLTIYKPQLTSILSITHRITGIALIGYAIAIVLCAKYNCTEQVVTFIQSLNLSYSAWVATKFFIILPFNYHMLNGVRHLMWDFGLGLTLKSVYVTGYLMLAATIFMSILVALQ